MLNVIKGLKSKNTRKSTSANYLAVWRQFNKFLIQLDRRPRLWEDRVAMFCAHLIENGAQSQTVKSYVSAIKSVLKGDGYQWNDNQVLLESLIGACRLQNDTVKCHLPIRVGLLEILLFEIQRKFADQPYLEVTYKTMSALMYYGLLRIGEVVQGTHTMKAKDIHVAGNKDKIMIVLCSSKTHGKNSLPQKIKITAVSDSFEMSNLYFCPFKLTRQYVAIRGTFDSDDEHFFLFNRKIVIQPANVRAVLCSLLADLNLNPLLYNTQSFRAGRVVDMLKSGLYSLEEIKVAGRWKSSIVYQYLKQ